MIQLGFDKGITWGPDGGAGVPVNVTGWGVDDGGDLVEVTHTGTGGQQAFLAGIQRCGGNCTFWFDTDNAPTAIGLRFGVKGTITVNTGTGTPWSLHVSIEKVGHRSTVNGAIGVDVAIKSDAINTSGGIVNSVTYPK